MSPLKESASMAFGRSWISGSVSSTSEMRSALAMALEKSVESLARLRIGLYMLVRYPTTTVSSQIGRASCRERVEISEGDVSVKKKRMKYRSSIDEDRRGTGR